VASVFDFEARILSGASLPLSSFRGKALLIVNVASHCGFTPQYRGLQELYGRHRSAGFEVLGFPCNQFGAQEPGNAEEISEFCRTRYGITFPLFEKLEVNGPSAHPLFRFLKESCPGIFGLQKIRWNFTKFLVDREGKPLCRYASRIRPEKIERAALFEAALRP
jgi:glutathione peroxidase